MTRHDLILNVATRTDTSVQFATDVVDVAFDEIALALCRGEELAIARFGVFRNRDYTERTIRNPQTGKPMLLAARLNPEFRSGPTLKARVNEAHGITGLHHRWSRH